MLREYGIHPHELRRYTRRELDAVVGDFRELQKQAQEH